MAWIKDSVLDFAVLILIGVFAFTSNDVIQIILWVYTGILLLSKILYFFVGYLKTKAQKTSTPDWVYHIVYLLGIALFAYSTNYYLAGAWFLIWILSLIPTLKTTKKA